MSANTDRMLFDRLRELDPARLDHTDPTAKASLTMLQSLLRLVAVACDAEGLDEAQTERIVDRVIIGGLPSPGYRLLMEQMQGLQQRLIDLTALGAITRRPE